MYVVINPNMYGTYKETQNILIDSLLDISIWRFEMNSAYLSKRKTEFKMCDYPSKYLRIFSKVAINLRKRMSIAGVNYERTAR
jgi:hypothetical protein